MTSTPSKRPPTALRHLPLALILGAAVIGAFAFRDVLTFDALARHREALLAFRDAHYLWASLGFIAAYAAIVALSLPGATIATLAGGFLFGLFPGTLYNVLAASLGAAGCQHQTAAFGGHAGAETVAALADQVRRLVSALHRGSP